MYIFIHDTTITPVTNICIHIYIYMIQPSLRWRYIYIYTWYNHPSGDDIYIYLYMIQPWLRWRYIYIYMIQPSLRWRYIYQVYIYTWYNHPSGGDIYIYIYIYTWYNHRSGDENDKGENKEPKPKLSSWRTAQTNSAAADRATAWHPEAWEITRIPTKPCCYRHCYLNRVVTVPV